MLPAPMTPNPISGAGALNIDPDFTRRVPWMASQMSEKVKGDRVSRERFWRMIETPRRHARQGLQSAKRPCRSGGVKKRGLEQRDGRGDERGRKKRPEKEAGKKDQAPGPAIG